MNMAEPKVKTGYSLGLHKAGPGDCACLHMSSLTQSLKHDRIVDPNVICQLGNLFLVLNTKIFVS